MNKIEEYNELKKKYKDAIVIIKDNRFYKTYFDDAEIIHYIMRYKYKILEDEVSFGFNAYNNVIERLNNYGISYLIKDNDDEYFVNGDSFFYDNFLSMALSSYEKEVKLYEISELLKKVVDNNYEKYDEIKNMLSNYLNEE